MSKLITGVFQNIDLAEFAARALHDRVPGVLEIKIRYKTGDHYDLPREINHVMFAPVLGMDRSFFGGVFDPYHLVPADGGAVKNDGEGEFPEGEPGRGFRTDPRKALMEASVSDDHAVKAEELMRNLGGMDVRTM